MQAWLEAEGSPWCYYHPVDVEHGARLTVAGMGMLWPAKTKHWRSEPEDVSKVHIMQRVGEEKFERQRKAIEVQLPRIMSIDGKDHEEFMLLRALRCRAMFDCRGHPGVYACSCANALDLPIHNIFTAKRSTFIAAWNTLLINTDDAFDYIGDTMGATLFKVCMNGTTPEQFAAKFFEDPQQPHTSYFEPATSVRDLVTAMLAYWAIRMRGWHASCNTKREVRTKEYERMKSTGVVSIMSQASGEMMKLDVHEQYEHEKKLDPLCRYFKVPGSGVGHQHTVVLYAKNGVGGEFGYELVEVRQCHEEFMGEEPVEVDLPGLTAEIREQDLERARAVRAEW